MFLDLGSKVDLVLVLLKFGSISQNSGHLLEVGAAVQNYDSISFVGWADHNIVIGTKRLQSLEMGSVQRTIVSALLGKVFRNGD